MAFRLLCVAGLLLAGAPCWATPAQPPSPLDLSAALGWAERHNPTLIAARIGLRQREGVLAHAERVLPANPRLGLEAADRDAPGGRASTDIGIRLSQEFWIGGQAGLRERAAQARLTADEAELRFLQVATRSRVRAAFLDTLVAERAVASARDVVAVNRDLADYAERRLDAGQGTRMEANVARIGAGRAKALLARARSERAQARIRLRALLALEPGAPLQLAGRLKPTAPDMPDRQALIERAVAQRDDLAAAASRVAAAREELQLARRQIIPNLTVFGFYREEEASRIAGGGLSLPLPVLHRYGGERQQAVAGLEAARLQRETLAREVRLQVLSALSGLQAARQRVAAMSEEVVVAARENFRLTQRAFQAGELGAPALTAAQDTLINTRRDYLDALRELVATGTELERATGGLMALDNAPVNE
ncbi:TolC family protein [Algiphilus aromaticivorans]|uniref:TolC family protein n=1 Tax=Algiphilus aromaticivorans TaxID=382454 RepID=UPI000693929D|nr:TolC family protein [Algiphilus aromaticivorans]